jgi:hypothetical protein
MVVVMAILSPFADYRVSLMPPVMGQTARDVNAAMMRDGRGQAIKKDYGQAGVLIYC